MTNKTKQFFILSIMVAGVSAVVVSFLYTQIQKQIKSLDQTVTSLTAETAKESAQVKLVRLVKDTETDRAIIGSYFFGSEGDSVSFISNVEALATAIGLTRTTESIDKVTDPATKAEMVKMVFRVSGEKEKVVGFLKLMETTPYHSLVESFDLSSSAPNIWQGKITMSVTIKSI